MGFQSIQAIDQGALQKVVKFQFNQAHDYSKIGHLGLYLFILLLPQSIEIDEEERVNFKEGSLSFGVESCKPLRLFPSRS